MVVFEMKKYKNKFFGLNVAQEKESSEWFKGNFYLFSADKMRQYSKKYGKGVKKPTAVETKELNGEPFSRIYFKPIQAGENWD